MGPETVPAVDARTLHERLNLKRDFSHWMRSQITRARLVEGRDFLPYTRDEQTEGRGGANRQDYMLTVDAAKHIAMMSGTDRGFEIREYFISAEKELQSSAPNLAQIRSNPNILRELVVGLGGDVLALQAKNEAMTAKAEFADAVGDAKGAQPIAEVAKVLRIGPNRLFAELRRLKVLLPNNLPRQSHIEAGRFRVVQSTYRDGRGERKPYTRTLVTGKGLAYIQRLLAEKAVA